MAESLNDRPGSRTCRPGKSRDKPPG
jgi:hypothetical protein